MSGTSRLVLRDAPPSRERRSGALLRHAVVLGLLEPGEAVGPSKETRAPGSIVARLRAERCLPEPVWEALDRLTDRALEEGVTISWDELEPADRALLRETAWRRVAVQSGRIPREVLAAAAGDLGFNVPVAPSLVERGVVTRAIVAEITSLIETPRRVCGVCFEVVPEGIGPEWPCPYCLANDGPDRRTDTKADKPSGDGREELEHLPGRGGPFAGHELLERVGAGGMGVVFKARQIALNRIVALKILRGGALTDHARRRRFFLEAEAAASLKHPGIVPVHEIGEVEGYPFYTMDFVAGTTLDKFARREKLAPRAIATLVRHVVGAVHHFHVHGIIHRDLKPENVLVPDDGLPRIIDFGIAKKLNAEDGTGSTLEGDVLGTLDYMSPEQAAGRVSEVDTRSDVYSLGAILYQLLAGEPPFKGPRNVALLLAAIEEKEPPRLRGRRPEIDVDLEAIVGKALAKERERRYQSAAELADDLRCYELQLPIRARPATFAYRLRKALRRHRGKAIGAAGALGIAVVASAFVARAAIARRNEVRSLLARGEDRSVEIADREKALERALFLDSENEAVSARRDAVVTERKSTEALAREEERRKQEALEAKLARAQAEAESREAKERERVRTEAEKTARAEAETRATELFARAERETGELPAIRLLSDALALLPVAEGGLREKIEDRKIALELRQARRALTVNEAGLAEFWLDDARSLPRARESRSELDALAAKVHALASGLSELEQARELLKTGALADARVRFGQARAHGVARDVLEKDLSALEAACTERAGTLVEEARGRLRGGEAVLALSAAGQALRVAPDFADAAALASDCQTRIAGDARREAATLWARGESRHQALAVLDQAARTLHGAGLARSLERERSARARLIDDPAFGNLVLVPEVAELGTEVFYVERTLVTNAAFLEFVTAKGYETDAFWDEASRPLRAGFRDGCTGGACEHRGPRTWASGSYGDEANANRPVSGITLHEARAYARWLSVKRGARWRLPTEREWEVAAGWDPETTRLREYPWRDGFLDDAWTAGAKVPRVVGSLERDASALGLLDPGDSVREWVERADGRPGTKGADFAADEATARYYARVRTTGSPGAAPSPELVRRIGLRLVREVDGAP